MNKLNLLSVKNKNRCSSFFNWTNSNKLSSTNVLSGKSKSFRNLSTIETKQFKKKMNTNRRNKLFNDLKKYENKKTKYSAFNIRDIDIVKEKQDSNLVSKITSYLEKKREKIALLNKLKQPKLEDLKKLLHESRSEQNLLSTTFSTKFIGTEEYKTLSKMFEQGHCLNGARTNRNDNDKNDIDDDSFLDETKTNIFPRKNILPMNITLSQKEKQFLNSVRKIKKKKIKINSPSNYYDNQYNAYKSLQINLKLYNQLLLKQKKEQIKLFLKNELENEQQQLSMKLMPKIHTIELSKYKKDIKKKDDDEMDGNKLVINTPVNVIKLQRSDLFRDYNYVYLKNISKFLSTPTCRGGAKMISIYDDSTNNYKMLLFGGINTIRLDDLWECSIVTSNKTDKKYIWKKVETSGDKPRARNGHSMNIYKNHLVIFGGIIEDNGMKVHEDLLCYDIQNRKFSVEFCTNKYGMTWRCYHIAEILGQYMLIYGGGDEKGNIIAEPWALDLEKMRWDSVRFTTDNLPRRKYHCSCLVFSPQKKYNSKFNLFKNFSDPSLFNITQILVEGIYMFGGIDENLICSNDVLIIRRGKPLNLFKAFTNGTPPAPRCECTMDLYEKLDVLVIYGGRDDNSKSMPFFNDMFFLDLQNLNWIKIELNYNENFCPRSKHCSCVVENELIIFGGANQRFLKSDLLICNLDLRESVKILKVNKFFKGKNKSRKDKNEFMLINENNDNGTSQLISNPLVDENGSLTDKVKLGLNNVNKFKRDSKLLMAKNIETKNFFLNFPEQKNRLQEEVKEIDEINYHFSDQQKVQDIIKDFFFEPSGN